jgi:regulator of replication initiation timing
MGKPKQIVINQLPEHFAELLLAKQSNTEKLCGEMNKNLQYYREDNEKLREENKRLKNENEDLKNELREPYSIEGMCKKLGVCDNILRRYREDKLLDFCTDGQKKIWFLEEHLQEFYRRTDSRNMININKTKRVGKNKTGKFDNLHQFL